MMNKVKNDLITFSLVIFAVMCGFLLTGCETKNDKNYIINFIVDEKLYHNMISSGNETITLPDEPQKEGYNFDGWSFTQDSIETEFTSDYFKNKEITSNINVYAKFNAYNLIVALDVNGGKCESNEISVSYGESFSLPIPYRDGYDFAGWYCENEIIEKSIWNYNTTELTAKWNQIYQHEGNIIKGLTEYGKTLSKIKIPANIDGDNILYIDSYSFKNCYKLKEICIPSSIKSIGLGTFSGCTSLEKMTIPFVGSSIINDSNSKESVFGYIFGTEDYVGGYKTIQEYNGNYDEVSYYIPTTLKIVNILGGKLFYGAFNNCVFLENIYLPSTLEAISRYAFASCKGLNYLDIPLSVKSIGDDAFAYCSSLKEISLHENITSIGSGLFDGCTCLESVVLPNSIRIIESCMFRNCHSLTNIVLPNEIIRIEWDAFNKCESLKSLIIPDSVTTIDISSFNDCINLSLYFELSIPVDFNFKNTNLNLYWYSENTPSSDANKYWHYDIDNKTILKW